MDLTDLYETILWLEDLFTILPHEKKLLITEIKSLLKAIKEKEEELDEKLSLIYEEYGPLDYQRKRIIVKEINLKSTLWTILLKLLQP